MASRQKVFTDIETIQCQVGETIATLQGHCVFDGIDDCPSHEEDFSSQDLLQAIAADEDGDAWLFVELQKGHFVFDHAAGRWYE
ncbi:MAG: hypothetical protein KJ822_09825 [Proteobacteria bacterium]|nr:hypothetical protein [Pseudomonadota bacterium]MBU4355631.1 hypothetical protein [Pseudomonadota bacterium]